MIYPAFVNLLINLDSGRIKKNDLEHANSVIYTGNNT